MSHTENIDIEIPHAERMSIYRDNSQFGDSLCVGIGPLFVQVPFEQAQLKLKINGLNGDEYGVLYLDLKNGGKTINEAEARVILSPTKVEEVRKNFPSIRYEDIRKEVEHV
ncbi:MAG: hypothetical protein U9Q87_02750 [Pseudomonadota bacterium]|nr:hypothetical protein [Pseudomonadota bacterium]